MRDRVARAWELLHERPTISDGLLAVVLAGLTLWSLRADWAFFAGRTEADPVAVGLALLTTLPLTLRRRRPLLVYAVVGVSTAVYSSLGYPATIIGVGVLIAIYTVATLVPLREAIVAGGIYVVGMLISVSGIYGRAGLSPEVLAQAVALNLLLLVLAWTVGVTVRTRRAYIAELEARAALLEREQQEHARLAVALERGRIARELHDAVAHAVSVMVVQSGAAERSVDRDPTRAREAMGLVARTGREALGEMRRMLGALRDDEQASPLVPQPGLAAAAELADKITASGLPVELSVQGEPRPCRRASTCPPIGSCRRP